MSGGGHVGSFMGTNLSLIIFSEGKKGCPLRHAQLFAKAPFKRLVRQVLYSKEGCIAGQETSLSSLEEAYPAGRLSAPLNRAPRCQNNANLVLRVARLLPLFARGPTQKPSRLVHLLFPMAPRIQYALHSAGNGLCAACGSTSGETLALCV